MYIGYKAMLLLCIQWMVKIKVYSALTYLFAHLWKETVLMTRSVPFEGVLSYTPNWKTSQWEMFSIAPDHWELSLWVVYRQRTVPFREKICDISPVNPTALSERLILFQPSRSHLMLTVQKDTDWIYQSQAVHNLLYQSTKGKSRC